MPRITRQCEVCQAEFRTQGKLGHTRCIRHRKRQTDGTCQGCGVKLGPRAWFCADCAADREKARDRRKKKANAELAKQIVGCEGCGADTPRGSRRHVHIFCDDCVKAQYEFWRRSAEGKGRFPFIRNVELFHKRKEQARYARINARLIRRVRARGKPIRRALKGELSFRPQTFGYSVDDLRWHLERQFTKGMTWDKFHAGEIHIDHRLPLASFDLSNAKDVRAAWALTNLQPLWAEDNVAKGASRDLLL